MSASVRLARFLQRRSVALQYGWRPRRPLELAVGAALSCGCGILVASAALLSVRQEQPQDKWNATSPLRFSALTTRCDYFDDSEQDEESPTGYTEAERFMQSLEYHRSILPDYQRRWADEVKAAAAAAAAANEQHTATATRNSNTTHDDVPVRITKTTWPRNIPSPAEIPSLELDLTFCLRSPSFRDSTKTCKDIQFRLASYYIIQSKKTEIQQKGLGMLKSLAEHGHPDGMCLYGRLRVLQTNEQTHRNEHFSLCLSQKVPALSHANSCILQT